MGESRATMTKRICGVLDSPCHRALGAPLVKVALSLLGFALASCYAIHPSGATVPGAARAASRASCPPAMAAKLNDMSRQLVLVGATRGDARAGTTYSVGGTAFPVTRDGYYLTAAHCVENRKVGTGEVRAGVPNPRPCVPSS